MSLSERIAAVRVVIADDDDGFAESLTLLLSADVGIHVVGRARTGEEAIALVQDLRPDLVLMDLSMPGMTGLEATERLSRDHPETLVLILTGSSSAAYVAAATKAGAAGFLTKNALSADVTSTIVGLAALAGASRHSPASR